MRWNDVVGQILMSALGGLLLLGAMGALAFAFEVPEVRDAPLLAFYLGFFAMVVLWWIGLGFTHHICASANAQLFALTPLTPSLYYRKNARRVAIPLFAIFIVVPAIAVYSLRQANLFGTASAVLHPFILNFCLAYILVLIVPLNEALAGRRWSMGFFYLRVVLEKLALGISMLIDHMIRALRGYAVLPAAMLGLMAYFYGGPALAGVQGIAEEFLRGLVDGGGIPQLVYFLLVPVSGLFCIHQPETPPAVQWSLTGLLSLLLAACLWSIRKHWNVLPRVIDERGFEYWITLREVIEDTEEAAAETRKSKAPSFSNVHLDGALPDAPDAGVPAEIGPALEYDPAPTPERQLVRHIRFWQRGNIRWFPFRYPWLGAVLVGWIAYWWIQHNSRGNWLMEEAGMFLLLPACVAGVWLAALARANRLREPARGVPGIPLRWVRLCWRDVRASLAYLLAADALAALLMTLVSGFPLFFAPFFLAMILLLRGTFSLGNWITFHQESGGKLALFLYYVALSVTLLVSIFMYFSVFVMLPGFAQPRAVTFGPFVVPLFALICMTFLVTLFAALVIRWRCGPQLVAPPPRAPAVVLRPEEEESFE